MDIKSNSNKGKYLQISSTSIIGKVVNGFYRFLNFLHIKELYNAQAIYSVSGETITLNTGGAGTTGKFSAHMLAPIVNSTETGVGSFGDSSFSVSGTALTTEVAHNYKTDDETIFNSLNNGEYSIDYSKGVVYYKKADSTTSVTVSFKYFVPKRDTELDDTNITIDNITVETETPEDIDNGTQTVTTAGTRVPLTATSTIVKSVIITAQPTNTGNIYVGGSNVDSNNGNILAAGRSITFELKDLNKIYIDADVSGEGVRYTWVK